MSRRSPPWPSFLRSRQACHRAQLAIDIAFSDCDPMGMLWHGRYLAYFERARDRLGHQVGIDYHSLLARRVSLPVVRSQVVHYRPARPLAPVSVEAALFPTDQPRVYHRFTMRDADQTVLAEGETEQVLVDETWQVVLVAPEGFLRVMDGGVL